jgi:hypothetical protein
MRDFMGDDGFAEALSVFQEKLVQKIKKEPGNGFRGPRLLGKCFKQKKTKASQGMSFHPYCLS